MSTVLVEKDTKKKKKNREGGVKERDEVVPE